MPQTISKLGLITCKQELLSIHNDIPLHKQAKHAHNDEYMYQNETNRVHYQPLTTPRVVLIFIIALHLCDLNNNMKPKSTEGG